MTIKLDTPTVRYEATDHAVTRLVIELPHHVDPETLEFELRGDGARIRADVSAFDPEGNKTGDRSPAFLPYQLWPEAVVRAVDNIVRWLEDGGNVGQGTSRSSVRPAPAPK